MLVLIFLLNFKITEATFLLSLLGLHLPLDLLLHDDTVLSVPIPVSNCALYTAVAGLQKEAAYQDLEILILYCRRPSVNTFLQPAHRLFLRLVTSAWQNQQMLSALSSILSFPEALAWQAALALLASASAFSCLVFLPSCRILLILFLFPASGQSLRQKITMGFITLLRTYFNQASTSIPSSFFTSRSMLG